jgi:peptidoglycan/LPS O-acetylase OafA/YrhL
LGSYFRFERLPGAIPALDGLRGIAILMVLGRHAGRAIGFDTTFTPMFPIGSWDLMIPMLNGWAGVDLFFVLSGFLMTHYLLKRKGQISLRKYWLKRLLRIVPAYYAVLLVVALGLVPLYPVSPFHWWWRLTYHLLFLQDYLHSNFVVAFWSLGVEEKFYLLVPLLMLLFLRLGRGRGLLLLLLCICISPLCRLYGFLAWQHELNHVNYFLWLRSPFHMSCDSLLIGALVAWLYHHRLSYGWLNATRSGPPLFWVGLAACVWLLGSSILVKDLTLVNVVLTPDALALSFGTLMLGMLLCPKVPGATFWNSYFLLIFCRLSYCIYLVHMLFMNSVLDLLWLFLDRPAPIGLVPIDPGFFLLYLLVFTAVSVLVAMALHFAVEKPFLILKDRVR